MGTVVAIESAGGVAMAGDTREAAGGTVRSDSVHRIFDFDSVGAGAVGDASDVQEFERRLESEIRSHEIERDEQIGLERLGRIAARLAEETNVEAVVAARDDDDVARVREVGADGRVLSNRMVALGSGAQTALGELESVGTDIDLEEAASLVEDAIGTAIKRDVETGGAIDVWTLADESERGTDK